MLDRQTDKCTIFCKLAFWARGWQWGLGAAHVWVQNHCRCLGQGSPSVLSCILRVHCAPSREGLGQGLWWGGFEAVGAKGLLSPPQGHPIQREIPDTGEGPGLLGMATARGSQAAPVASAHSTRAVVQFA